MRDINRIDDFLKRLGDCWKKVPDWRFGQLISNITFNQDMFHYEDVQYIQIIEDYFKEDSKNG